MDQQPLQDPQHALQKLAELQKQVAELEACLKRSSACQPAQSAASCAEISESSAAESVTQSISKLSIASSRSSWERHWSVEPPSTKGEGYWKAEHEELTTTKGGHWAEWQQADDWTKWRENRDPSAGPPAGNPGTLSAGHGEAAGGGRQHPCGNESSSSMGEIQLVAEAQIDPKKIALAKKRVRQAQAKRQAKEAQKLQRYEEQFAAMEEAYKLPPQHGAEPIVLESRDLKAKTKPAPKRIAGGFQSRPPCGDCGTEVQCMKQKAVWKLLRAHELETDPPAEWAVTHYCVSCWARMNGITEEEALDDIHGAQGEKKRKRAGARKRSA